MKVPLQNTSMSFGRPPFGWRRAQNRLRPHKKRDCGCDGEGIGIICAAQDRLGLINLLPVFVSACLRENLRRLPQQHLRKILPKNRPCTGLGVQHHCTGHSDIHQMKRTERLAV